MNDFLLAGIIFLIMGITEISPVRADKLIVIVKLSGNSYFTLKFLCF